MDTSSSNDDEPKVCTVFASSDSSGSKTVFDTIAFSVGKKEPPSPSQSFSGISSEQDGSKNPDTETDLVPSASSLFAESEKVHHRVEDVGQSGVERVVESTTNFPQSEPVDIFQEAANESGNLAVAVENLTIQEDRTQDLQGTQGNDNKNVPLSGAEENEDSPIPTANVLFADAPEVPFPVGQFSDSVQAPVTAAASANFPPQPPPAFLPGPFSEHQPIPTPTSTIFNPPPATPILNKNVVFPVQPQPPSGTSTPSTFNTTTFSTTDTIYDAWIPKEETRRILSSIVSAVQSGTYFPDKSHTTMPGVIYEDDLVRRTSQQNSYILI